MSLRGVAPFLAAVLLGLGPAAYPALAADRAPAHQHARAVGLPTLPTLAVTSPAPVLSQAAGDTWQTTVLVTGADGNCPLAKSDYALQVSPVSPVILVKVTRVAAGPRGPAAGTPPAQARSCQVRLAFSGLRQVPSAATLVLDGSSSAALTVLRQVTFFYYLGVPAIVGAAMAVLLLLLALVFVPVYDRDGVLQRPLARRTPGRETFWTHLVFASGAWTANDSWATNIAALGTVIATAVGLISATDPLFPGVVLDRFVILNALAGGIVVAAPLVLAIRYARWLRRQPGATDEAALSLRPVAPAEVRLPVATAVLAAPTRVARQHGGLLAELPAGTLLALPAGSTALVPGDTPVALAGQTKVRLGTGTPAGLPPHTPVRLPGGALGELCAAHRAELAAATDVTPRDQLRVPPQDSSLATFRAAADPAVTLRPGTAVRLSGTQVATLAAATRVALPDGATGSIPPTAAVPLAGLAVMLPEHTQATVAQSGHPLDGVPVSTLYRAPAAVHAPGALALYELRFGPPASLRAPSGAVIAAPWGATAISLGLKDARPAQLQAGHAVQVPPGTDIAVLAGGITLPGGSDVFTQGDTIVEISAAGGGRLTAGAGRVGALVIGSSDLATPHGQPAGDVMLPLPVRVTVPGGAKLTVNGIAQVTLPPQARVSPPHWPTFPLTGERRHFRWPQGANSLTGTLGMVILAALVTVFGIGAELGLAGVLVAGVSGADTFGRCLGGVLLALLGLFILRYSVTAIRTLADPQPGSSMSSTAGTSFTL